MLFNPINIFRVVDCRENEYIPDDEDGLGGVDAENVVVLEFGGSEGLKNKMNRGETATGKENKTITNFLHQQNIIGDGFSSQGWALF